MHSKQVNKIMTLFAEMGGGIAITREQVAQLIEIKGVDCANLTIKRLQETIKFNKKTANYRKVKL